MSDYDETDATTDLETFRQRLASSESGWALVAKLNEDIHETSGLDARTLQLVRCAALAAMGAPASSWEAQLAITSPVATDAEILGVLIAIAPVIGTARYAAAMEGIAG